MYATDSSESSGITAFSGSDRQAPDYIFGWSIAPFGSSARKVMVYYLERYSLWPEQLPYINNRYGERAISGRHQWHVIGVTRPRC